LGFYQLTSSSQLIGTAGEIPKAPVMQTKFLEDMDESELAQAVSARTSEVARRELTGPPAVYSSKYLLAFRI
jgi:hypothetical protein